MTADPVAQAFYPAPTVNAETTGEVNWRLRAACRDHPDPDVFFPEVGEKSKREEAKLICRGCPVRRECGQYASERGPVHGVWGGVKQPAAAAYAKYRSPMARLAGLQPCGTTAAHQRHRARGETPCVACAAAKSADELRRRAQ